MDNQKIKETYTQVSQFAMKKTVKAGKGDGKTAAGQGWKQERFVSEQVWKKHVILEEKMHSICWQF